MEIHSVTNRRARANFILWSATVWLLIGLVANIDAQTFTTLHSFAGSPDGQFPIGGLVADGHGNFYGTTQSGGSANGGTVFKVTSGGTYSVIYNFNGTGGKFPSSALFRAANGLLYGTTYAGGASGLGTVFKLQPPACGVCSTANPQWKETVIHSFSSSPDGRYPVAGLVQDAAGNLYGVTGYGGLYNRGTVYKLDSEGNESVIYSFAGNPDGAYPLATLIIDSAGNLYGTTTSGGSVGVGTVFSVSPAGVERTLYSFTGVSDGAGPYFAPLVRDSSGNLYGTTYWGGNGGTPGGVAFKLTASGSQSVLYNFCSQDGCGDGWGPLGGVILGTDGNLYGTTAWGGWAFGTVFELSSSGQSILYSFYENHNPFQYPNDGGQPSGPLVQDASGSFYGTTRAGGSTAGSNSDGFGTIFRYTP